MHIFLTGGTGTIGSAVLACAAAAGHKVTALARSDQAAETLVAQGASPLFGDLSQPDLWMPQATSANVFIHLASSFDDAMAQTETQLMTALATQTATRATPLRVLYTGGCWLYGETRNAVADETSPMRPIAAFDWAVRAISDLQAIPNLSTAIMHPAMVYDAQGGVFSRMLTALRAGRPAPIWGSEHTRWPLVHAADAARAYLLLAETPQATGPLNIVAEQGVPIGEIANTLATHAGIKARPAVLPRKWVLARHGAWGEGPMLDQQMRSSRMGDLGWVPEHKDYAKQHFAF